VNLLVEALFWPNFDCTFPQTSRRSSDEQYFQGYGILKRVAKAFGVIITLLASYVAHDRYHDWKSRNLLRHPSTTPPPSLPVTPSPAAKSEHSITSSSVTKLREYPEVAESPDVYTSGPYTQRFPFSHRAVPRFPLMPGS
jgi:hypothetical protein